MTSLNKGELGMAIPALTQEYKPVFCSNSRNAMRHPPQWEMRPIFPALGGEQFCVRNETCKDPQCASWNSTESPSLLSQDERNTAVTSEMQNSLLYPKSTRIEAHFPFIDSLVIPCSTSYRTSGLTSFRKLQRFPDIPVSSLYEY